MSEPVETPTFFNDPIAAEITRRISEAAEKLMAGETQETNSERSTMTTEAKQLAPHQQRVVTEKNELDEKLAKLLQFIDAGKGPIFSTLITEEKERLTTQGRIMREYSDILADRINAF